MADSVAVWRVFRARRRTCGAGRDKRRSAKFKGTLIATG